MPQETSLLGVGSSGVQKGKIMANQGENSQHILKQERSVASPGSRFDDMIKMNESSLSPIIDNENRFNGQEIACSVNAANTSPIMAVLADDPTVKQVCAPVLTVGRRVSGNSITMPHPPDLASSTSSSSPSSPSSSTSVGGEKGKIQEFLDYASKKNAHSRTSSFEDTGIVESGSFSDGFQDYGVFDLENS